MNDVKYKYNLYKCNIYPVPFQLNNCDFETLSSKLVFVSLLNVVYVSV